MEGKLVSEHDVLLAISSLEAVFPVDSKREFKAMRRAIEVLPASVATMKRGKWVGGRCGQCGCEGEQTNFCPNCGAVML